MLKHLLLLLLISSSILCVKNINDLSDILAKGAKSNLEKYDSDSKKGSLLYELEKEDPLSLKKATTVSTFALPANPDSIEKFIEDFFDTIKLPDEYKEPVEDDIVNLITNSEEDWALTRYIFNRKSSNDLRYVLVLVKNDGKKYHFKQIDVVTKISIKPLFVMQSINVTGGKLKLGLMDTIKNKDELEDEELFPIAAKLDYVASLKLSSDLDDSSSDDSSSSKSSDSSSSEFDFFKKFDDKKDDKKKDDKKKDDKKKDDKKKDDKKNPFSNFDFLDQFKAKDGKKKPTDKKKDDKKKKDEKGRSKYRDDEDDKKKKKKDDEKIPENLKTFKTVVDSLDTIVGSVEKLVQIFKSSKSETVKQRIESKGYDYFNGKSSIQIIQDIQKEAIDDYLIGLEKRLKVPNDRILDLKEVIKSVKISGSNFWATNNVLYSIDDQGTCKYASILFNKNDDGNFNFIVNDIDITFKFAPDLLVINRKLSILGGLWSEDQDIIQKVPKSINQEDIQTMISFFNIISYKDILKAMGYDIDELLKKKHEQDKKLVFLE
jgi:hypothetical protein